MYNARADELMEAFQGCDSIVLNKPGGAFYYTVMFKEDALNNEQTLPIENDEVRKTIESMTRGIEPDKRFVYYLMGSTGIVVVPLTGFQCTYHGFRATLLEHDDEKRAWILKTIRDSIEAYVGSTNAIPV